MQEEQQHEQGDPAPTGPAAPLGNAEENDDDIKPEPMETAEGQEEEAELKPKEDEDEMKPEPEDITPAGMAISVLFYFYCNI